jgi:hypothetical protein
MVGVMIGSDQTAQELMYEISSCEGIQQEDCINFVSADDFNEFAQDSKLLANSIALQVGSTTTTVCEPGLWWLCLLLLLPLLLVLLVPCCVSQKKKVVKKRKKHDLENPPPAPVKPDEVGAPGTNQKKRFKWDTVAADHYIWQFGGGCAPMKVDYGDKAPPSAPKDLSKGKIKRGVQSWEDADGWTYEVVEEDLTLEQWAEDKAKSVFCCCCCCISKKK